MLPKYYLLILILLVPLGSRAAGLEVSPSRLEIRVDQNNNGASQILVKNPNPDVTIYDVYVDEFSDIIAVAPSSFTLEANENKTITVYGIKNASPRLLKTNLSIVSRPLTDYKFKASAGLKVPLLVTLNDAPKASPSFDYQYLIYAGGALLLMIIYLFWLFKNHRRKTTVNHP